MNKKQAFELLNQSATMYKDNLLNNSFLFVFKKNTELKNVEVLFLDSNFQHLTGLQTKLKIRPKIFFEQIINNRFNIENIMFKKDGTTDLKLRVLPNLMNIHKSCKMIGCYNKNNFTQVLLDTDMTIGNIKGCIGISKYNQKKHYYPKTALNQDIRKITYQQYPVLCILKKSSSDKKYNQICYISKKCKEISADVLEHLSGKTDENFNLTLF